MSRMSPLTEQDRLIGSRIRRLRERIGMGQEELGASLGKNQPYISRLEAGTFKLKLTTAAEIASKLGVTIDSIAKPILETP